jgi:CheY-like chemotaxis protein
LSASDGRLLLRLLLRLPQVAPEDEGCDVIAASNSRTLLDFMEQLPVPRDFGNDLVLADDDFPGTNAEDLHRQLKARGWSIPVFTVSFQ